MGEKRGATRQQGYPPPIPSVDNVAWVFVPLGYDRRENTDNKMTAYSCPINSKIRARCEHMQVR